MAFHSKSQPMADIHCLQPSRSFPKLKPGFDVSDCWARDFGIEQAMEITGKSSLAVRCEYLVWSDRLEADIQQSLQTL